MSQLTLYRAGAIAAATLSLAATAGAQGRCIRAYGTPACNTDPIKPVFDRTGWRTTALDHITWRVADAQKEAALARRRGEIPK